MYRYFLQKSKEILREFCFYRGKPKGSTSELLLAKPGANDKRGQLKIILDCVFYSREI
jgi:hypothetical protein